MREVRKVILDLVRLNRSYRRFHEDEEIDMKTLRELVNLARLSASGANLQPLKYLLSNEPEKNNAIFPTLAWAGYLKDWSGPSPGERPSAYITLLLDTRIAPSPGCDHGIASQSILLGAAEKGLGGCFIASIKKDELRKVLELPEHLEILLVLALGKPKEQVVIDDVGSEGQIKYWRDDDNVHHVPKRKLEDIILD